LELPSNPTPEQIALLENYVKEQKKYIAQKSYGKQNYYEDREDILPDGKLIIFRHKQYKSRPYYMRLYVNGGKYKSLSLKTTDRKTAHQKAIENWRKIQNHIDSGGTAFEKTTIQVLEDYLNYLQKLVDTEQLKKHTLQAKKTSLKKLRVQLEPYDKPHKIPENIFENYATWRRTINWDKSHHKNNPRPPSDLTINKELTDFLGFFRYCNEKKHYVQEIKYPFLKIEYNKMKEKNPSYEIDDWCDLVYYLRTWQIKKTNINGNLRKNIFYKKAFACLFKILGNSGMRVHEALLLKWNDIDYRKSKRVNKEGVEYERISAIIQISPDTKTGRREVICPAGIYFRQLWDFYKKEEGRSPKGDEYCFRNIGTVHSRGNDYVGKALSDTFMRKMWYQFMEEFKVDKNREFYKDYTIQSCRAFFINTRLADGVPPSVVGQIVGHSTKTMDRYYKNIEIRNLENQLVTFKRKKLQEADFLTYDMDTDQPITK